MKVTMTNQHNATPDQPAEIRVFKVPVQNLGTLEHRLSKLNRRAVKLGSPEIRLNLLEVEEHREELTGRVTRVQKLTVEGPAPRINGWTFIGTIEPTVDEAGQSIGNEVRPVPGQTVPPEYRETDLHCDHCRTARYRREIFILRHDDGHHAQVGRNCLRDFLGHTNPELYASIAEMIVSAHALAEESEEREGGPRREELFALDYILEASAAIIRTDGWRSKKTAQEFDKTSTSDTLNSWVFDPRFQDRRRERGEPKLEVTDQDRKTAQSAEEWMGKLSGQRLEEDYFYNLNLCARAGLVKGHQLGLVASAIAAWSRDTEREINRRKRLDSLAASRYVGEPGKRVVLTLKLEFTREFENDFGKTTLYKFLDEAGNVVVWWSSRGYETETESGPRFLEVGDTIRVNATIKNHEERDGIQQTVVTRCAPYLTKEEKAAQKKKNEQERRERLERFGYCVSCEGNGLDFKSKNRKGFDYYSLKQHLLEHPEDEGKYHENGSPKCPACGGSGRQQ